MKDTMCGLVKEVNAPSGLVYHTDLSIPEINDDEVLIKVHCSAICGTDLHIMEWDEWSQKRIKAPVTVGHETAGEIVAVGKNVTERKVGDRVSCESHIPCGECYFCKNGMPHICKNVKLFGCTQNGAFAEYAKIRWDCTFLLEDDVTDGAACMFEPMGAGIHGVEAAEVNGKTVLVSGPIGLTAISASKTFGAVKVIACDLIDEKLEVAKKMGADAVLNSAKCDLPAEVRTLTGGVGVDAAIDITGNGKAIVDGIRALRKAGIMVSVGLPDGEIPINLTEDIIYREVTYTGISGRRMFETWEDCMQIIQTPGFSLEPAIGGVYPLSDFEEALNKIKSGVPGKMILIP